MYKKLLILVSIFTLLFSLPVCASEVTISQAPKVLTLDSAKFTLEAPGNISKQSVQAEVTALSSSKVPSDSNFYVTNAVDVSMKIKSSPVKNSLLKPVRMIFKFDMIDFKRASKMNTNLSIGYYRIGIWNEDAQAWDQLPSTVFWNGNEGIVEAETGRGDGIYGLIWANNTNTQLSSIADPNGPTRIIINAEELYSPVSPYIKNNYLMVPIRIIAENLGGYVSWDAGEKRIDILKNGSTDSIIQLWIGKNEANIIKRSSNKKEETPYSLDVAPEIISGTTYIPLRFVSEALGAKVSWEGISKTARIYTN